MVCTKPLEVRHGLPAKGSEKGVEQAELCIVNIQQPHITNGDCCNNVGHIDNSTEKLLTAKTTCQDDCQNDCKPKASNTAVQPDLTDIYDRCDEQRRMEQLNVIVQSCPRPC